MKIQYKLMPKGFHNNHKGCVGGNITSFKKGQIPWNKKNKISLTCKQCSKIFFVIPSVLKRKGRGQFCSKECFDKSKEIKRSRVCVVCGNNFFVKPSRIKNKKNGGKYCSNDCKKKNLKGKGNPKYNQIERKCVNCKKQFLSNFSRIKKGGAKLCSMKCMSQWRVVHPVRIFKDTSIELKIKAELDKRNIFYKKNHPLEKTANVDFYLPIYNIIIQCDGDYWHNLPKAIEKDKRQDKVLKEKGYIIYRFWEHEINESSEQCINRIKF